MDILIHREKRTQVKDKAQHPGNDTDPQNGIALAIGN
jgi:hypothetical protein